MTTPTVENDKEQPKKQAPYQKPELTKFGKVKELTLQQGSGPGDDDGGGGCPCPEFECDC